MKRIAVHLLLALALILQGSVAALGAVRSHTMHGPCCPDSASATRSGAKPAPAAAIASSPAPAARAAEPVAVAAGDAWESF